MDDAYAYTSSAAYSVDDATLTNTPDSYFGVHLNKDAKIRETIPSSSTPSVKTVNMSDISILGSKVLRKLHSTGRDAVQRSTDV